MKNNMKNIFQINEAIHLSRNGIFIDHEETKTIMSDILLALMKKAGITTTDIIQAGVFLQDDCKSLIPVVNNRPLYDLEKSFTLAVKSHSRICKTPKLFVKGYQDIFTMGFVAAHGFVSIRIKEHNIPWLQQRYFALTGVELPDPAVSGNYFSVSSSNATGSGDYYHLGFPRLPVAQRDLISFGSYKVGKVSMSAPIRWDDWDTCAKYNSKNYIMTILGLGFRLGKNTDNIANIRTHVDSEAFDAGCKFEIPKDEIKISV